MITTDIARITGTRLRFELVVPMAGLPVYAHAWKQSPSVPERGGFSTVDNSTCVSAEERRHR